MQREFDPATPELMDLPQGVSDELVRDLENLESLNRHFGSHRLMRRFAKGWLPPGTSCRVLDLATGAGDLPRTLVDWARSNGVSITVDAVDFQPATLEVAASKSAAYPEIRWLQGDIRTFEGAEEYDLVLCSLALHHFSEADAVQILERCRVLSRRWVLVSDLERSLSTSVCVWAVTQWVYREPMTRYDARLSAKRAFSKGELCAMAEAAGWRGFGWGRFLFARQAVWLERE